MFLLPFFIFTALLLLLSWFDLRQRILPDFLNYSLLWSGLVFNPIVQFVSLYNAILGVIAGYSILWICYQGFKCLYHQEGLGYGDLKLLAALSAWFGWQVLPILLFIATTSTLSILMCLKFLRHYPQDPHIPFGPGLCFAGLILYLIKYLTLF